MGGAGGLPPASFPHPFPVLSPISRLPIKGVYMHIRRKGRRRCRQASMSHSSVEVCDSSVVGCKGAGAEPLLLSSSVT